MAALRRAWGQEVIGAGPVRSQASSTPNPTRTPSASVAKGCAGRVGAHLPPSAAPPPGSCRQSGGAASARANSAAVANRSAGLTASARLIACSTASGTLARSVRTCGSGSQHALGDHGLRRSPRVRHLASEHLVQDAAEAVEVRAAIHARRAGRLLGAHVGGRADRHARGRQVLGVSDLQAPGRCRSRRPVRAPARAGCSRA